MGEFVTGEAAHARLDALADQVDAAYADMRELSSAAVGSAYRVQLAEHLAALGPTASRPDTTAKSTTARTGHRPAGPTPTRCSSRAPPDHRLVTDGPNEDD